MNTFIKTIILNSHFVDFVLIGRVLIDEHHYTTCKQKTFKGVCQHFDSKELDFIAHKIRYYMKIHSKRKISLMGYSANFKCWEMFLIFANLIFLSIFAKRSIIG